MRRTRERSSRPSLHWIDCCEKENGFKPVSSCKVIFVLHSVPSEKTSRLASRTLLELRHDALRSCGRAVVVFGKKEEESKTQMLTSKTFMEGKGPAKILWFGAKRYVLWRVGPTVTCGCAANLAFVSTTATSPWLLSSLLFFFTLCITHG